MLWAFAFAILLVALLIPILAVLFDAPALRRRHAPRLGSSQQSDEYELLARRLATVEDELDDVSHAVRELQDEVMVLQRLLEASNALDVSKRLPPSRS
jgi:hypothetical protein